MTHSQYFLNIPPQSIPTQMALYLFPFLPFFTLSFSLNSISSSEIFTHILILTYPRDSCYFVAAEGTILEWSKKHLITRRKHKDFKALSLGAWVFIYLSSSFIMKKKELKARWGHWLCNETWWEMDPDTMGRE